MAEPEDSPILGDEINRMINSFSDWVVDKPNSHPNEDKEERFSLLSQAMNFFDRSDDKSSVQGNEKGEESHVETHLPSRPPTIAQAKTMSTKELKAMISRAGLSSADCFEKEELFERAKEAVSRLQHAHILKMAEQSQCDAPTRVSKIIASYPCILIHNEAAYHTPPDLVVFVFHGYQASAKELALLCEHMMSTMITKRPVQFVLPQAHGSQWWPIQLSKYAYAAMMGESEKASLLREIPDGVPACRESVRQLLEEYMDAHVPLPHTNCRIVLMGFSQGGTLSLDNALEHTDLPISGVILMSAYLIAADEWATKLSERSSPIKVLQMHGLHDKMVPFESASWMHEILKRNGADVTFRPHTGGHDLGDISSSLKAAAHFLDSNLEEFGET